MNKIIEIVSNFIHSRIQYYKYARKDRESKGNATLHFPITFARAIHLSAYTRHCNKILPRAEKTR